MLLPGRASGEAAVPMWEGVPSRHHERTCAANDSGTMGDHLSATLAATVLPDWCSLLHEWWLSACALPRQCCNDGVTKRIVSRDDPSGHQERCLAAALPRGHTLSLP